MASLSVIVNAIVAIVASCYCLLAVFNLSWFLSSQNVHTALNYKIQESGPVVPVVWEILYNVGLCLVFLLPHSVMAARWWKKLMTDLGIVTCQRSLYILATAWTLQVLMRHASVVPLSTVWYIDTQEAGICWLLTTTLHIIAWILIFCQAIIMDLPEMLGLKQAYYDYLGCEDPLSQKAAATRRLYANMRHGGAICLYAVLWLHPMMTASRVVIATMLTIYVTYGFSVHPTDVTYLETQFIRKHSSVRVSRAVYQ